MKTGWGRGRGAGATNIKDGTGKIVTVQIAYLASQWLAMCETDAATLKRRLLGWAGEAR